MYDVHAFHAVLNNLGLPVLFIAMFCHATGMIRSADYFLFLSGLFAAVGVTDFLVGDKFGGGLNILIYTPLYAWLWWRYRDKDDDDWRRKRRKKLKEKLRKFVPKRRSAPVPQHVG